MLNCGLTDLRLVRPRDGWPSGSAKAAASGADIVLDNARLCDTTEEAIADLSHVFATTARNRGMIKRIMTPREAALEMRAQSSAGHMTGVLFGPERTGLFNDDLALADTSLTVPLNPSFSSLNLAQAVLLLSYEWMKQAGGGTLGRVTSYEAPIAAGLQTRGSPPASRAELMGLFEHIERELDASGFFTAPEKRPSVIQNLRSMLVRMGATEQEIRTLRGIVKALVHAKGGRRQSP